MITDLKKIWRLVDSPLVSILWLLALGCAGLELLLAQVIQSVMQHAAFTVSMITLAAATVRSLCDGKAANARSVSIDSKNSNAIDGSFDEWADCN